MNLSAKRDKSKPRRLNNDLDSNIDNSKLQSKEENNRNTNRKWLNN
jgi:hypothetical protein